MINTNLTPTQQANADLLEEMAIMVETTDAVLMEKREEIDNGQVHEYHKPSFSVSGPLHYNGMYTYHIGKLTFKLSDVLEIVEGTVYLIETSELLSYLLPEEKEAFVEEQHTGDTVNVAREFVLAGNATFTVKNHQTGNEFTYRVVQNATDYNRPHWVSVMFECEYKNVGVIFDTVNFRHYAKCHLLKTSPEWKAFNWVWDMLTNDTPMPEFVTLKHEGKCGRCGRKLRVTESIVNGIGPVCAKKLGLT